MKIKPLLAIIFVIFFLPSIAVAQQSFDVQSSIDLGSESILSFLGSPELMMVLLLIVGLSVAVWLFYLLSSFQMGKAKSTVQNANHIRPELGIPPDILSRVAAFSRFSGGMNVQIVPAYKEEEPDKNERTKSAKDTQRGK